MKQREEIHPVYFFYGTEGYLIEEEVENLKARVLSPQDKGLNLHLFNGDEHGSQQILGVAQTLPMFSKYRFVYIQKAEEMEEEEVEKLLKYLAKPCPTTCLVLRGQEAGPWRKHLAKIRKVGQVMEFSRLRGRALTAWMNKRMQLKGKKLSEDAANHIVDVVGDHLQDLDNVLERVFLASEKKDTIELSDVEGLLSDVKSSTIYELSDAIGKQNLEKALGLLRNMLATKVLIFRREQEGSKQRDPTPLLLSTMARQYRLIWKVKEMAREGRDAEEIAGKLTLPSWSVRTLMDQARKFPLSSLRTGLLKCQTTDLALKKSQGREDLLMEKLLIDLCHPSSLRD